MIFKQFVLSSTIVLGILPTALSAATRTTCFPPNKLHLRPSPLEKANVSERRFGEIISRAEKIYTPIVKSHGARLKINRLWKDETVNASAVQNKNIWEVNMYGGLARRPEVTADGFALVLCHELGHHLGGYVMVRDGDKDWASNEGQSDYFATESCAKEIWRADIEENARHRETVLPFAKSLCDANHIQQPERDLCYRSSNAGLSLASLLAALRNSETPKFETPSKNVVAQTNDEHPEAQCRLDTYMAGALCTVPFNPNAIPGKGLARGGFSLEAERLAGETSCLARDGWVNAQRPRCWFKPHFEFMGLVVGAESWSDTSRNGRAEPGETLQLNIPLENKWSKVTQQVAGELYSLTQGVHVTRSKAAYPDIQPGRSSAQTIPFEIKVAKEFVCGRPFELIYRANSASGTREFPLRWFVGPRLANDFLLERSTDAHPIDDYPSPGLSLAFEVQDNISVLDLELQLTLKGNYPEEIALSLTSPDGQVHDLKTTDGYNEYNRGLVRLRFKKAMNLRGRWSFNLKDIQENDTAVLESFDLRAPFAEKVDCRE